MFLITAALSMPSIVASLSAMLKARMLSYCPIANSLRLTLVSMAWVCERSCRYSPMHAAASSIPAFMPPVSTDPEGPLRLMPNERLPPIQASKYPLTS